MARTIHTFMFVFCFSSLCFSNLFPAAEMRPQVGVHMYDLVCEIARLYQGVFHKDTSLLREVFSDHHFTQYKAYLKSTTWRAAYNADQKSTALAHCEGHAPRSLLQHAVRLGASGIGSVCVGASLLSDVTFQTCIWLFYGGSLLYGSHIAEVAPWNIFFLRPRKRGFLLRHTLITFLCTLHNVCDILYMLRDNCAQNNRYMPILKAYAVLLKGLKAQRSSCFALPSDIRGKAWGGVSPKAYNILSPYAGQAGLWLERLFKRCARSQVHGLGHFIRGSSKYKRWLEKFERDLAPFTESKNDRLRQNVNALLQKFNGLVR